MRGLRAAARAGACGVPGGWGGHHPAAQHDEGLRQARQQGDQTTESPKCSVELQLHVQNTLIYRASDAASHPFRREIEAVMAPANCVGSAKHQESRVHWMYSDDKVRARVVQQLL